LQRYEFETGKNIQYPNQGEYWFLARFLVKNLAKNHIETSVKSTLIV